MCVCVCVLYKRSRQTEPLCVCVCCIREADRESLCVCVLCVREARQTEPETENQRETIQLVNTVV